MPLRAVLDHQRSVAGAWGTFQKFAYTLNTVGNRTERAETNGGLTRRDTYSYLADDQLDIVKYNYTGTTQDRTVDYNYDAVGNRTTVSDSAGQTPATYTANALNQYASAGGTVNYDSNGNLAYGGSAGNLIYTHDAQNRLTATQGSGNNASLSYDARNRCVKRVVPFTTGSGQTTTYLVWDCWTLLAEYTMASGYDGSSYVNVPLAEARRYVHGAEADEVLLAIAPTAAQTVHHVHDWLGNVTALTDASGSVVERYTYDVFGKSTVLNATGTAITATAYSNRFLFTGREWIAELGLYDYRNRYYSATIGRFLETDPINYVAGDVNIYRYAWNSSVDLTDPDGLEPALPFGWHGPGSIYDPSSNPFAPTPTPDWHKKRNDRQKGKCPSAEPKNDGNWKRDNPAGEKLFHCGNTCYRKPDPDNKGSSFQCCYDKKGKLVTKGSKGAGTYDYEDPDNGSKWIHTWKDVIPSVFYGDNEIR